MGNATNRSYIWGTFLCWEDRETVLCIRLCRVFSVLASLKVLGLDGREEGCEPTASVGWVDDIVNFKVGCNV